MNDQRIDFGYSVTGNIDHTEIETRSQALKDHPSQLEGLQTTTTEHHVHEFSTKEIHDCEKCQDSCCTSPHVTTLRIRDVERLVSAGLGWAIAPASSSEQSYPTLKQIDGRCVFLKPDMKCAAYSIRPLVCRAFPLQVSEHDPASIRFSNACQSRRALQDSSELESMARLAAENFSQKVSDAQFTEEHSDQLLALGLLRFVKNRNDSKSYTRNFDEILARKMKAK